MKTLSSALLIALSWAGTSALAGTPGDGWQDSMAAWSREVVRADAQLRAAIARGAAEPADREATVAQVRAGARGLHALLLASAACDSLLTGPFQAPAPPYRRPGEWGNRFVRATSVVAVSCGLANLAAGMREVPDHELRQMLGNVSGAVGGTGALFSLLRPRPKPPPYVDPVERARTLFREESVRETFAELRRHMHEIAAAMDAVGSDLASSDSAAVVLVQRYAGALELTAALFDTQAPHAMALARTSSAHARFSEPARARLARLADQLERIGAEWRTWRWLVGRSQRAAFDYLVVVERQ